VDTQAADLLIVHLVAGLVALDELQSGVEA
jgi:hypothetical protein